MKQVLNRTVLFYAVFFLTPALFAADVAVIPLPSTVMKKRFQATIVLPASYTGTRLHYPVIYLLHGYSGDHTVWPRIANLKQLADNYQLLFVCPDAENSWYCDSRVTTNSKFETYLTIEVISSIDKSYRTWPEMKGRAIVGLSMGGHGALTLLARHPDLYCGAGSIAGIMDLSEFPDNWELSKIFGPFEQNRQLWSACSFTGQYAALANRNKGIVLDCGESDFALNGNRKAHALLSNAGIPHVYNERPGAHNQAFAAKTVGSQVLYFSKLLKPAQLTVGNSAGTLHR